MWTALALTTVLAAPAEVKLTNDRVTVGLFGQERKDDKFVPGDTLWLTFDIEGLEPESTGEVTYAMGMEVLQKGKSKPKFKQEPITYKARLTLGGTTLPAYANAPIDAEDEPGEYTLKISVADKAGKGGKPIEIVRNFQVVKPELSFVSTLLTNGFEPGRDGSAVPIPAPSFGIPGQKFFVNTALAGVTVGKDGLPDVEFEMQILDAGGKPTVKELIKGEVKTDLKKTKGLMVFLPMRVDLNRAGEYTIVLRAKDKIAGKETTQKIPYKVLSR